MKSGREEAAFSSRKGESINWKSYELFNGIYLPESHSNKNVLKLTNNFIMTK